ncbi:MAG: hypothetical protein HQ579_05060 [Candidatus Omnitrophica bacterium]|nr:hypothetical protein [Candidatus Omnitrophota bacterium]
MTFAEKELLPLGFKLGAEKEDSMGFKISQIFFIGDSKLKFDCVCPSYPEIKALGCPLHHEGPGGSGPIEEAKKAVVTSAS